MPKSSEPISLPEEDYLSILDTIKSFNQCDTRSDLRQCLKDVLLPLFEAQSALYCWVEPEQLSNTQLIDTVGYPDESEIKIAQEMQPYVPINKLIVQSTRPVLAYDVDIPREVVQEGIDLFFKDHPQSKRSKCLVERCTTAIITVDRTEITMGLGLHRWIPHDKPFTLRDIRVMELLRPHLLQTIKTIILQEEVAQYKSMVERLADCPTAIALIRPDTRVIFRNQAFYDLLRINRGSLLPNDLKELIQKESAKYDPPYKVDHSGIELPFYTLPKGVFRVSLNLLKGRGVEEDKRYLLRLKPAIEPYTKMNLLMQESGLTAREMEVAVLVKDGMTNHEIAERLFISQATVKTHLQRIFEKMEVNSRVKLIAKLSPHSGFN